MLSGKGQVLLYLIFTIALFSCGTGSKNDDILVISGNENWNIKNFKTAAKNKQKVINFGITPIRSGIELRKMLKPLLRYLSEKTGRQFVLNIAADYKTTEKKPSAEKNRHRLLLPCGICRSPDQHEAGTQIHCECRQGNERGKQSFLLRVYHCPEKQRDKKARGPAP